MKRLTGSDVHFNARAHGTQETCGQKKKNSVFLFFCFFFKNLRLHHRCMCLLKTTSACVKAYFQILAVGIGIENQFYHRTVFFRIGINKLFAYSGNWSDFMSGELSHVIEIKPLAKRIFLTAFWFR